MQDTYILKKITPPSLPRTLLHRTSLIAHLKEAITQEDGKATVYKLVLLCAPAGYGKTTLLADFAHSSCMPCCWYFLDHIDTDCAVFLHSLLVSLRYSFPQFGVPLDTLFTNLFAKSITSNTSVYRSAIDALCTTLSEEITGQFVLCLCNYEEVNESKAINDLVTYLLKKLPPQVTLVIESRVMPDISLVPLLVREEVYGLNSTSLRFSAQEISELAKIQGLATLTNAEQLVNTFDGWIAGILLGTYLGDLRFFSSNSIPNEQDASRLYEENSEQKRKNLFAYVVNEVFQRDMAAYNFLLGASILQQMEPAMCDALLEITSAADHLANLEQRNLFVTSYNTASQSVYICHSVIRSLLIDKLRQQAPERFIALHCKAAELWHSNRNYDQAMYHATEAGAYHLQVRVILDAYRHLLQQGHLDTLKHWLELLPPTLLESHPRLLVIQATVVLTYGLHTTVFELLEKASALAACAIETDCSAEAQTLQAEISILRSKALFQAGDYPQAQILCQQALVQLPDDEIELRAAAEMRLGICANLQGEFASGLIHLQRALHIWNNQPPVNQAVDIHGALTNTYYLIGNFTLAEYHLTRALDYCEQLHDDQSKVENLIRKGILHWYQGAYLEAETALLQALALARKSKYDQRGEAYALANLGSLYLEQEKYTQALALCEDGLVLARQCANRSLINITLSNIAVAHVLIDDITSATLFAEQIDIQEISGETIGYEQTRRELTYAMIFLYQKCYDEAYACLSKIEADLNSINLKREQLQVKLRLAACQLGRGQQAEVEQLLNEVLSLIADNDRNVQLVLTELKWQPALLSIVESLPQFAQLRETLGLEADPQSEVKALQTEIYTSVVKSAMPKLTLLAFGEPTVLLDDHPIEHWRMARAMELFFLLLDASHPLSKEQIITMLWPEFDDQINQTFHSTLHHLRKLLGKECFIYKASGYSLDLSARYAGNVWYDVEEFQQRRAEADQAVAHKDDTTARKALLSMIELYRGDYGRPFYSDWCTFRRDELRTSYLEAHRQLAQIAWRSKAYNESIRHWRQVLSIDNCQEEAHYNIMLCYLRQSKRTAALRQYQSCKELLQQELSIQPGVAIEHLRQSLIQ